MKVLVVVVEMILVEKILVEKIVFVARWCLVGWILLFRMIFMVVKVQKMLNMVLQLNVKVSDSGAAQRSLEEITDEELDLEIQKTARALLLEVPIENVEVSEEVDAGQLD